MSGWFGWLRVPKHVRRISEKSAERYDSVAGFSSVDAAIEHGRQMGMESLVQFNKQSDVSLPERVISFLPDPTIWKFRMRGCGDRWTGTSCPPEAFDDKGLGRWEQLPVWSEEEIAEAVREALNEQ